MALIFAAVLIANINATATIGEPFSTTSVSVDYSGFAGETVCVDVDLTNAASVPLDATVVFTETSNPNGVIYTTNMPLTPVIASGANTINTCVTYDGASPAGSLAGIVTINRV